MKKSFFIAAISIFATCFGVSEQTADKGYHSCHRAVYGRAEFQVTEHNLLPFGVPCETTYNNVNDNNVAILKNDGPSPLVTIGTVPVAEVAPIHKIKFKNGIFTIEHTGTYVIHYFFKAFSNCSAICPITIAIKVNGKLIGIKKLNPVPVDIVKKYEGNGVVIKNLNKDDTVSLEVIGLPSCSQNGAGAFNANLGDSHLAMFKTEEYIFYSNCGELPDIAAYLMIHKAEQDD